MREWRIPVTWEMYGIVYVEADTLEDAMAMAYDSEIPDDGEYMDGTLEVGSDTDDIRKWYNNNAPDSPTDPQPDSEPAEDPEDTEIEPIDLSDFLQINT